MEMCLRCFFLCREFWSMLLQNTQTVAWERKRNRTYGTFFFAYSTFFRNLMVKCDLHMTRVVHVNRAHIANKIRTQNTFWSFNHPYHLSRLERELKWKDTYHGSNKIQNADSVWHVDFQFEYVDFVFVTVILSLFHVVLFVFGVHAINVLVWHIKLWCDVGLWHECQTLMLKFRVTLRDHGHSEWHSEGIKNRCPEIKHCEIAFSSIEFYI